MSEKRTIDELLKETTFQNMSDDEIVSLFNYQIENVRIETQTEVTKHLTDYYSKQIQDIYKLVLDENDKKLESLYSILNVDTTDENGNVNEKQ